LPPAKEKAEVEAMMRLWERTRKRKKRRKKEKKKKKKRIVESAQIVFAVGWRGRHHSPRHQVRGRQAENQRMPQLSAALVSSIRDNDATMSTLSAELDHFRFSWTWYCKTDLTPTSAVIQAAGVRASAP
jgi:hypothetical protein